MERDGHGRRWHGGRRGVGDRSHPQRGDNRGALFGLSTAPIYPLLVLTTAERTSAAVADRLIGFQAAASALGAAVIPPLIGLAMGVSASAFGLAIAPLCLTAALLHIAMQVRRRG
jgi:hypothetical protein